MYIDFLSMMPSKNRKAVAELEHFIWEGRRGKRLWKGGKCKQLGGRPLQMKGSKIHISVLLLLLRFSFFIFKFLNNDANIGSPIAPPMEKSLTL